MKAFSTKFSYIYAYLKQTVSYTGAQREVSNLRVKFSASHENFHERIKGQRCLQFFHGWIAAASPNNCNNLVVSKNGNSMYLHYTTSSNSYRDGTVKNSAFHRAKGRNERRVVVNGATLNCSEITSASAQLAKFFIKSELARAGLRKGFAANIRLLEREREKDETKKKLCPGNFLPRSDETETQREWSTYRYIAAYTFFINVFFRFRFEANWKFSRLPFFSVGKKERHPAALVLQFKIANSPRICCSYSEWLNILPDSSLNSNEKEKIAGKRKFVPWFISSFSPRLK